jgi:hypothetical protein
MARLHTVVARIVHVIDFRYHIVSIVAVFLALGLGLFIGSTSLRGKVSADLTTRTQNVTHTNGVLRGQLKEAQSQIQRDESFDAALTPYAVQGRLAGQSVVVISAPGVDDNIRSDVVKALGDAGATVNGDVRLQDSLIDPSQDQFLGTLADRVALSSRSLPNAAGGVRALALLADVLVTNARRPPVPHNAASKVLAAYDAGNLVSVSGNQPQPANLAVVLAAPAPADGDTSVNDQKQSLLGTFARYLDRDAMGTVVAGPATAADKGGLLDVVRSDKAIRATVSTVDTVDAPSGVIAVVYALVEQTSGGAGSYGIGSGADRPLPTPSP